MLRKMILTPLFFLALASVSEPSLSDELAEEQKMRQEEFELKLREIEEKNKKIEEQNSLIEQALKEGIEAFQANDFNTAIAKFNEGYESNPNFVGSAPILLNNKGMTLKQRAVITYNDGVMSDDPTKLAAATKSASEDFSAALDSFAKALEVSSQNGAAEVIALDNLKNNIFTSAKEGVDVIRLMVLINAVDGENIEAAKNIVGHYLEVEQDKTKQAEAQGHLASFLFEAYDFEGAVAEFRKANSMSFLDPEHVGKFGLALFTLSELNKDRATRQESLNYMDRYLLVAPNDHSLRGDIESVVETLKAEGMRPGKIH